MAVTINGSTGITTNGISDTTGTDALNNVTVAGTLAVTGATTLTGAATMNSTLAVTGAITSSGLVTGTTGALYPLVSGTAQASTSGTSITFTGIPSWVKRITVMFNGVSTNGTSNYLVQIGSGSVTSTGYQSVSVASPGGSAQTSTSGIIVYGGNAGNVIYGHMVFTLLNSNTWVSSHTVGDYLSTFYTFAGGGGCPNLSGTLDRVVITNVGGTDTFDAGSINIMYE